MLKMKKQIALLGTGDSTKDDEARAEFHEYYLKEHAPKIAANENVNQYYANKILIPSQELLDAGWGWAASDKTGIFAIDEMWCKEGFDFMSLYEGDDRVKVLGAYDTDEVIIKPTVAQWEIGTKSPWIKRIGLCKCREDENPKDFFDYWERVHAPLALHTHIGAGFYSQSHIKNTIVEHESPWNGMMVLDYWSIDAFRFGHFSRPTAAEEISQDCKHFLDIFCSMLGEEYVIKRNENYLNNVFDGYDGFYHHQ